MKLLTLTSKYQLGMSYSSCDEMIKIPPAKRGLRQLDNNGLLQRPKIKSVEIFQAQTRLFIKLDLFDLKVVGNFQIFLEG